VCPTNACPRPCGAREKFSNGHEDVAKLEYDAAGHLTKGYLNNRFRVDGVVYDGGVLTSDGDVPYQHDARGLLIGIGTPADYRKFTWGPDGVTKMTIKNRVLDEFDRTYVYDDKHRLVTEQDVGTQPHYYAGAKTHYYYDAAGRLVSSVDASSTGFAYDARGRVVHTESETYTWDAEGRLSTASGEGVETTWEYECATPEANRPQGPPKK
jgi:YD repeat-containing protein